MFLVLTLLCLNSQGGKCVEVEPIRDLNPPYTDYTACYEASAEIQTGLNMRPGWFHRSITVCWWPFDNEERPSSRNALQWFNQLCDWQNLPFSSCGPGASWPKFMPKSWIYVVVTPMRGSIVTDIKAVPISIGRCGLGNGLGRVRSIAECL